MSHVGSFNKLYFMLEDYIYSQWKKSKGGYIQIPYYGEIAVVEVFVDDMFTELIIRAVMGNKGIPDYEYMRGREPELISWLMRPNHKKCIMELEKTLFSLTC